MTRLEVSHKVLGNIGGIGAFSSHAPEQALQHRQLHHLLACFSCLQPHLKDKLLGQTLSLFQQWKQGFVSDLDLSLILTVGPVKVFDQLEQGDFRCR